MHSTSIINNILQRTNLKARHPKNTLKFLTGRIQGRVNYLLSQSKRLFISHVERLDSSDHMCYLWIMTMNILEWDRWMDHDLDG